VSGLFLFTATARNLVFVSLQCNMDGCRQTENYLNKTGMFLHGAVSSPQDCSKSFTLYFTGRYVQSNTIATFLESNQPRCNLLAKVALMNIHQCIQPGRAYSFKRLRELGQCIE